MSELELALYSGGDHRPGDLAAVLLPDLRQLFLHEPVQDPVLLADVVSHDRLQRDKILLIKRVKLIRTEFSLKVVT